MRELTDKDKRALERFEHLPDSAWAPLKVCALVSGLCERTWRDNPPIKTFRVGEQKLGANVGALRKLTRGELAS
jgi:hypothetical protein